MTTKEFVEWIKTTYREKTLKESTIVRWIRKNFLPEISIVVKRIENPMINKSSNEDNKCTEIYRLGTGSVSARQQNIRRQKGIPDTSCLRDHRLEVAQWKNGKPRFYCFAYGDDYATWTSR